MIAIHWGGYLARDAVAACAVSNDISLLTCGRAMLLTHFVLNEEDRGAIVGTWRTTPSAAISLGPEFDSRNRWCRTTG